MSQARLAPPRAVPLLVACLLLGSVRLQAADPAGPSATDLRLLPAVAGAVQNELQPVAWEPVVCPCPPAAGRGDGNYPTAKLGGFFQADTGWFHQGAANRAAVGDVQDGADFRRARLSASGDVAANIGYMVEFDFAFPGRPSFMDVYMDVREFAGIGTLRIGQWRQPFSMDGLTSVKELTFLERALPFALIPFRQIGIGLFNGNSDGLATWAVSAVRYPTDAFGGNVGDNGGYGVVGRSTLVPWEGAAESLLHVGGSFALLDPANDLVQYRNQPEFFVGETGGAALVPIGVPSSVPPFVDTGLLPTSNSGLFGIEAAYRRGSFLLQSEVMWASVNRIDTPDNSFWGAYAQASYLLTGEVRPYNYASGVFGRVTPRQDAFYCGGSGAWELAFRWSTLDLFDGEVEGGRLNDLTAGVNWYLARNAKFQFNYIHAFLTSAGVGDSDAGIVAIRAQVDF